MLDDIAGHRVDPAWIESTHRQIEDRWSVIDTSAGDEALIHDSSSGYRVSSQSTMVSRTRSASAPVIAVWSGRRRTQSAQRSVMGRYLL